MPGSKIVLVEDEQDLRSLLTEALTNAGFQVSPFGDVESFLKAKDSLAADVIITDGALPGMSGYDLINTIRKTDSRTPILLMTGVPKDGDGIKAITDGADDYLEKPVEINFLMAKVKRLIERVKGKTSEALPGYRLNINTNELIAIEDSIKFTGTEFEVFKYLFENLNELVARPTLESHTSKARSLDVHIHAIRRKIKGLPLKVETLKMKGYRLRVTQDVSDMGVKGGSPQNAMSSSH